MNQGRAGRDVRRRIPRETLSWLNWLGIALIGAGAVLVAYQRETTKPPRGGCRKSLHSLGATGAGEGIRTLDFNLGKVALYP
jgi:hypothetical protein